MAISIDQLKYVRSQLPSLTTGQTTVINALANTPLGGVIVTTSKGAGPVKCHQSALRALEPKWVQLTKTEGGYLTLPSKSLVAIITLAKLVHPREPILT